MTVLYRSRAVLVSDDYSEGRPSGQDTRRRRRFGRFAAKSAVPAGPAPT